METKFIWKVKIKTKKKEKEKTIETNRIEVRFIQVFFW